MMLTSLRAASMLSLCCFLVYDAVGFVFGIGALTVDRAVR
jgi:hypothetical protein